MPFAPFDGLDEVHEIIRPCWVNGLQEPVSWCTYGAGQGDVELAYQCVENFMNSPPHRQALLSPNYRDCTVGIIWSGKKYVCVVNFVRKDLW